MTTRIIAVVLAAVLAVVGAILLIGYVRGADERAFDGARLTQVLVVQAAVPAGTSGANLGSTVGLQSVPEAYVADGAVTDLSSLAGLVAAVDLVPGEQVLASRFVDPAALGSGGGSIAVPEGLQEISLAVDIQRVVGGSLVPGDIVGVFASLTPEGDRGSSTQLIETAVLVTAVASAPVSDGDVATSGTVLVNLAVSADQAQRILYTAEFGRVYLSLQSDTSTPPQSGVVTRGAFAG